MLKKAYVIHPILFALYPVLFLYEHNKDLVLASYIIRPMAVSLALAIFIFIISKLIIKDNQKASLITSMFLWLFFSFGHLASNVTLHNKYFLLFLWILIFISLSISILATRKSLVNFSQYLNIVAISLLIISLIKLDFFYKKTKVVGQVESPVEAVHQVGDDNGYFPDIYYIILDGYARSDILNEIYGYNNEDFIKWLTDKGFYIANQSNSNYPQTYLSISSSLNFEYLDSESKIKGNDSDDRSPLGDMIKNNKVYKILKEKNYKFVALPHIWMGTYNNIAADLTIGFKGKLGVNDFEDLFANTTPLTIFWDKKIKLKNLRNRILFSFNHLPDISNVWLRTCI